MESKLLVVQSNWGMSKLPRDGKEWSLEEKLERLQAACFDGIDVDIPDVRGREKYWLDLTQKFNLRLCVQGPFIHTLDEMKTCLHFAREVNSPYLEAQIGNAFMSQDEAVTLLEKFVEEADRQSVPFFVQTHRGRITQDLARTADLCREIPNLRLNLDLSHYFVSSEWTAEALANGAPKEKVEAALDPLLRRTSMIDGRISNGEQVQVDFGNGLNATAEYFFTLWKKAMTYAKETPQAFFVFRPELGPPPYSMTDLEGREISDRWEQAQVLALAARRLWRKT